MTHQILKHNDGRMLAVQTELRESDKCLPTYNDVLQKAIANGIEFKEKSHIHTIKWEIYCSLGKRYMGEFAWTHWEMEKMKPYDLPEGLTIKVENNKAILVK